MGRQTHKALPADPSSVSLLAPDLLLYRRLCSPQGLDITIIINSIISPPSGATALTGGCRNIFNSRYLRSAKLNNGTSQKSRKTRFSSYVLAGVYTVGRPPSTNNAETGDMTSHLQRPTCALSHTNVVSSGLIIKSKVVYIISLVFNGLAICSLVTSGSIHNSPAV